MKLIKNLFLLSFLLLAWLIMPGNVFAAPGWNSPNTITTGGWYKWPSVSNDGTRIVFLSPYSAQGDYNKQIQLIEYTGTSWGNPILLASNGQDDSDKSGWLPEYTHPVISGNGSVIAYLGSTSTGDQNNPVKSEIYLIDKTNTGWGTPYPLPTSHSRHTYLIALSYDGNTIAYVYQSGNIYGDTPLLFVSKRVNGVWGSPVQVSEDKGGASAPSLSADGTKLAWMQNNSLVYAEYNGVAWSAPQWLVTWKITDTGEEDVEDPKISADGNSITYWILTVEKSIMVARNLYITKYTQQGWDTPIKLTPTPVIPTSIYDSPAAVNLNGTKVIFQMNVKTGDVINGSYLEITEFQNGNWTTPTPLTSPNITGFETSPVITPDGKTLIYNAGGEIRSMASTTGSTGSFVLTVTKSGTGSGTVSATSLTCTGTSCTGTYPAGSFVILAATPDQGSAFTGWSQYCTSKSNTCVVTMDANRHVTATFNLPGPQPNTISLAGTVKDVSGNAISNALVEKAGDPLVYTATDTSGNFVLYGLPKDTTFHIKISKDGFIPVYSSNFNSIENIGGKRPFKLFTYMRMYENWGVQQGKSVINGVVADNENPQTGLSGAVLTATGTGGKTYTVTYEDAATNLFGGSATSSNGHFYILNVDNGDTVKVTVSLTGWAFSERTFVIYAEAMSEGSFFGTLPVLPVINLSAGWNFISFPKLPTSATVATVFADVSPNVRVVWGYDNSTKEWLKYSGQGTLTTIETGKGYWIYMNVAGTIDMASWSAPSTTKITLYPGWNLVGYNGTSSAISLPAVYVIIWNWTNGVWYAQRADAPQTATLTGVEQKKAYWIKMDSAQPVDWTQ